MFMILSAKQQKGIKDIVFNIVFYKLYGLD